MADIYAQNSAAWDDRARRGMSHARPVSDTEFERAAELAQNDWLDGDLTGKRVLCLAAGGGRHGGMFASLGAVVTVVDISEEMLVIDRKQAAEKDLSVRTVRTSMDELSMFADGEFDIVSQPVSTCYVPDIERVYREVARITTANGIYISQHKQPTSMQCSPGAVGSGADRHYALTEPYYREGPLPPVIGSAHREAGTVEFLHRWQQILGGLCRAGFVIEDVVEPLHADPGAAAGSFAERCQYAPPYIAIKARRTGDTGPQLIIPGM
jgi:SAM-dependent methyltransferase